MRALLLLAFLIPAATVGSQTSVPRRPVEPISMPQDRSEESYAIYSQLLPLGETASWPAKFYAVTATTITAVQPESPCWVKRATTSLERASSGAMNPHNAVSAPDTEEQDYEEVLSDFDSHCHEVLSLSADSWRARLPIHLLNAEEQDEFRFTRNTKTLAAAKYVGSPALYAFSQVYFNAHHTVGMVYATHWCGGLCGQGFWVVLRKENGSWKRLQWQSATWIS